MKIFQYDSKFNQVLMTGADLIIMNFLYILCCLPIFTIGAAQAGLFTGIRVLLDKEDDSSCAKAFFRGFANGFKTITIVHCIFYVLIALLVLLLLNILVWHYAGLGAPVWMVIVALAFAITLHTMMAPFHATFGCTVMQLLRNVFIVTLAHPLQSLLFTALLYLPVAVLLYRLDWFMGASILLLAIYYSVVYLIGFTLMKKPYQKLKDNFLNAQKEAQAIETEAAPVAAEEE